MTNIGPRIRREAIPMAILVTYRVGNEYLGMMTIFCHHNQNKIEACDALSALCQCDSHVSSVVVVRKYTNTPYIPQGTARLLYLDVSTLSGNPSSVQFPLEYLCLQRLPPYSKTKVLLPCKDGGMESKIYPYTQEVLWKRSKEEHCFLDPVSWSISLPTFLPLTEEGIQTEEELVHEGLGYNPALHRLQDYNQAKAQLECEVSKQAQKLAQKYDNCQIKMAKKHEQKWAKMAQKGHATFKEVFAMTSIMESIKLLPWCISSAVPSQYISEALAATVQLGENAPATTAAPKPKESTTQGPSGSPAHHSETPPIIPLLFDLPFMGTLLVRHPFGEFLTTSTQKNGTAPPVVHSTSITTRGPVLTPKKSKLGVITAPLRLMITCWNL